MFRTIDRYILREILPPFLLALLVFTFLLEIPPLMDVAERLIAKGVSARIILQIMVTLLPQALGITIPMALLVGILMGLGRISSDREAVAMQACGLSFYRLLAPVMVLGVAACAATSYVMLAALPEANQQYREITYNVIASRAEGEVKPRVFFEDFPNILLYVRDVPTEGGGWRDVFLADTSNPVQPDIFLAKTGRIILDRDERRVEVLLEHGTRHRANPDVDETYEVLEFERLSFGLNADSVFPRSGPQRGARELRVHELQAEVARLEGQGLSPHVPVMEIHKKFSIPAACLVFALIALSLGLSSRKDSKLASIVLGIGVIFVYYVFMYVSEAMAKGGHVSPHLAMWIPNIFLGLVGLGLLLWRSHAAVGHVAIPIPFLRRRETASPTSGVEEAVVVPAQSLAARPATTPGRRGIVLVVRVPEFSLPVWNLLDSYVVRLYLKIVSMAFLGLLGIFYIATFIDLSDKLFKGETTGATILQYFWFATPQYVYFVLPIAALVATLVTIGLLTKSSELTVMKACGISLYRVAVPLLVLGIVWSGVLLGLEESILGPANRRADQIRHVIRGGAPRTFDVLNRKWLVSRDGSIYHYVFYDPARLELSGLSVYDLDDESWQLTSRTYASQVAFRDGSWQAGPGWFRAFEDVSDQVKFETFEATTVDLETPDYFVTEHPDAERMTYSQLQSYVVDLQAGGFNVVPYLVALQRKLSFPFVTIVMTLLAIPFAVTTGSRGTLYGVGVGLVLALSYWVIISVFGAIGNAGMLAPVLAAWAPNIFFAGGAAYLLLGVRT